MSADSMLASRQKKFAELALERVSGTGRFSGYASLFGTVDLGRDSIMPGAFRKALETRGAGGVRMLFQHDPNQPIGRWLSIGEDGRGLKVEGQLSTGVGRAREIHELMATGAIDGLSIGFQTVKARTDAKTGVRQILEADLWEISIVTFPMLPEARVSAVKNWPGGRPTKREFERWLTRDAGFSRREARGVIARGYGALEGAPADGRDAAAGDTDTNGESDLVARLRRATAELRADHSKSIHRGRRPCRRFMTTGARRK